MLELTLPELGEESKQVKDLVFNILVNEQALSLIELTNKVKKHYNVSITYQAIRKAVNSLLENGVLEKNDKKYSLNNEWLLTLKSFVDGVVSKRRSGQSVHSFSNDLVKENYAVYTLSTLYELDNFWSDMLKYLANNLKKNEPKISINYGHYAWWMLINLGKETEQTKYFIEKGIDSYFVFHKNLPLNKSALIIYENMGYKSKIIENEQVDELVAMDTVGNTVIQVTYPKKIVKKIKAFFENYSSMKEMNMQELTTLVHEPCQIKFVVFKNEVLAKTLVEKYKGYFS